MAPSNLPLGGGLGNAAFKNENDESLPVRKAFIVFYIALEFLIPIK